MGSLSNLYISQSYTSLIHLGSDTTITPSFVQLQDGLGNSLGVSVNASGDISASGNIYGLNITGSTINTSSFVNVSSFNSYTSSTNARLSSIEATTASLNSSISSLNGFTQSTNTQLTNLSTSQSIDNTKWNTLGGQTGSWVNVPLDSLNAFTQSQDTKDTTLASVTASLQSQLTNIGSQSGSWITESETGSFATTGSNTFIGIQTISTTTGTPLIVDHKNATTQNTFIAFQKAGISKWDIGNNGGSDAFIVYNPNTFASPLTITQDNNVEILGALTASLTQGYTWVGNGSNVSTLVATSSFGTNINTGSLLVTASAVDNVITFTKGDASTFNVSVTVSGSQSSIPTGTVSSSAQVLAYGIFVTTSSFNDYTSSTNTRLSNLETTTASLNNSISNINSFTQSADVSISNLNTATSSLFTSTSLSLTTASFDNGTRDLTFTKGNGTQFSVNIPDVSGSTVDLTSLNAFTASQETKDATLGIYTASIDTKFATIGGQTGSYATTGSNTFVGNQIISGSLTISSSISDDLEIIGAAKFTGASPQLVVSSSSQLAQSTVAATAIAFTSTGTGNLATYGRNVMRQTSGSSTIGMSANPSQGSWVTGVSKPSIFVSSSTANYAPIQFESAYQYTDGRVTFTTPVVLNAALTGSLTEGYVWVGGVSNITKLVATSSFTTNISNLATTGSNTFVGTEIITGSLIVTGSARGNVGVLSITSNTASMDLSQANYFTLTLADTTTTHITATNIQPGTSATLVITTGTNSSASLAPILLQPSGSSYSATNGSTKVDILSLVSVGTTNAYVVSTKNMI
jgi:hypothetical protein